MTRPRPALRILALALCALGCRSASARPVAADASRGARPVVLLVHGRGRMGDDTASLRRDWERALNEGLRGIGAAATLRDGDVRLVWYADVLDARSDAGCTPPVRTRSARDTSGGVSGLSVFASIAGALLDAAAAAADGAGEGSDDARELRNFAGDLHFFGSARTRCATEQRVGDALARARAEGRPVVLVAYSLGALVSWGHLHDRALAGDTERQALPRIERFITLGSPVGSADVRALVLGGDTARVALPAGVQSWLNVVNPDDSFAVPLAPATGRAAAPGITDVWREGTAGDTPHDIVGYLRDPATARAIAAAFGGGR